MCFIFVLWYSVQLLVGFQSNYLHRTETGISREVLGKPINRIISCKILIKHNYKSKLNNHYETQE